MLALPPGLQHPEHLCSPKARVKSSKEGGKERLPRFRPDDVSVSLAAPWSAPGSASQSIAVQKPLAIVFFS